MKTCLGRCIAFGDFELYPEAGKLYRLGYRVMKARPQEVMFLTAIVERAGSKVTKKEITARLWPDETPPKNRLNVVVSDARSALGDTNRHPRRYIASLGEDGYCFVQPIKRMDRANGTCSDVDAEQAYRAGQRCFDKRDETFLRESVSWFKRALDHNPSHAQAWVGLANAQIMMGIHCVEAPEDAFLKARAAAEEALRIEPSMPDAVAAQAWVHLCYDRDRSSAADGFLRAIKAKPNLPFAHNGLALLQLVTGRARDAVASLQKARKLSPLSAPLNALLGHALYIARQYEDAIDAGLKAVTSDPDSRIAHNSLAYALLQVGKHQEAAQHFEMARQLSRSSKICVGSWGYASALLGRGQDAELALAQLTSLPSHEYVPSYFVALIHLGLGHIEPAIDWLNRACEEHSHWVLFVNSDPIFDGVRSHPRFQKLLEAVGCPNPPTASTT